MSAYIVDRNHILYLLASAVSPAIAPHGRFAWFHESEWSEVHPGDPERAADVANMLWRENIASVSARYPNESSATLPGPCNEDCVIQPADCLAKSSLQGPGRVALLSLGY